MHNQLYAPEIAHLVTMLAATGGLMMRSSIYGMAVNLLQALHVARAEDEAVAAPLRQLLDDLATPASLKNFGLDRPYPSSELSILEPVSHQIPVESLERITSVFVHALELGSSNTGKSQGHLAISLIFVFYVHRQVSTTSGWHAG